MHPFSYKFLMAKGKQVTASKKPQSLTSLLDKHTASHVPDVRAYGNEKVNELKIVAFIILVANNL